MLSRHAGTKLVMLLCGTIVTIVLGNYTVNYYGVFNEINNSEHVFYENERFAKNLYSYRYLPTAFDSLLIGSSFSVNYDVSRLSNARFYNASIVSANIFDQKILFDNYLKVARPRYMIVAIYYAMTETAGQSRPFLTVKDKRSALGSLQLFREYACFVSDKVLGVTKSDYDQYGRFTRSYPAEFIDKFRSNPRASVPVHKLEINELAFEEYRALLEIARKHGVKIRGFAPPTYRLTYEANVEEYKSYLKKFSDLFLPDEHIINFNDPEFEAFTSDLSNFQDHVHLTNKGAEVISEKLNRLLN
jgi:hypothetical protein